MYDYSEYAREGTDCWADFDAALRHARFVLSFGPPGTGKTSACWKHAIALSPKAESITLDYDTTRGNLLEMPLPGGENGAWVTVVGAAGRAYEHGHPLVVNELDRIGEGSGETVMHLVLDDPKVSRWTRFSGRIVTPGSGFACYATMNGTPDMLPSALRDRFQACVYIDKPHPHLLDAMTLPLLRSLADAIFADTPSSWPATPRQLLQINTLMTTAPKPLDFETALRLTIPETVLRDRLLGMAAAHSATKE